MCIHGMAHCTEMTTLERASVDCNAEPDLWAHPFGHCWTGSVATTCLPSQVTNRACRGWGPSGGRQVDVEHAGTSVVHKYSEELEQSIDPFQDFR